jgi:hypothetical protein
MCKKRVLASSCLSVRPSAWNSTPATRSFTKFHIWVFFESLPRKFKFDQNLTRITGILHEDVFTFIIIFRRILLWMRNVSGKRCRENQNTYFRLNNFSRKSCCLWNNVEKYGRAELATNENITRRMCFACWTTRATDTGSEYVILIAFDCKKCHANTRPCYVIRTLSMKMAHTEWRKNHLPHDV